MSEVCSGEQTFAQLRTGFSVYIAVTMGHSDVVEDAAFYVEIPACVITAYIISSLCPFGC